MIARFLFQRFDHLRTHHLIPHPRSHPGLGLGLLCVCITCDVFSVHVGKGLGCMVAERSHTREVNSYQLSVVTFNESE